MSSALVTGASSGIGRAFARRLATLGYDLVLVARDDAALELLADELRGDWQVDVEVLAADLATVAGCHRVEVRVADRGRPVDLVVNNAGFGLGVDVLRSDVDDEERMLRVMVIAAMRIAKAALPVMIERGRGDLILVSSTAGLVAHNSYGAAKAWAIRFSQALSVQLAGTGVQSMALCPGLTRTDFHRRSGADVGRVPGWLWLDADRVVQEGLRDLLAGKAVSVPSRRYRLITGVGRLLPTVVVSRIAARRGPGSR